MGIYSHGVGTHGDIWGVGLGGCGDMGWGHVGKQGKGDMGIYSHGVGTHGDTRGLGLRGCGDVGWGPTWTRSRAVPPHSFNQLDLPAYESYEKLRQMLLLAIQECSEGFGLA